MRAAYPDRYKTGGIAVGNGLLPGVVVCTNYCSSGDIQGSPVLDIAYDATAVGDIADRGVNTDQTAGRTRGFGLAGITACGQQLSGLHGQTVGRDGLAAATHRGPHGG